MPGFWVQSILVMAITFVQRHFDFNNSFLCPLGNDKKGIKRHAGSILRFTYRSNFPPLSPYHFTSDAGWGCMLRSAQMLMGAGLVRHTLGRGIFFHLATCYKSQIVFQPLC